MGTQRAAAPERSAMLGAGATLLIIGAALLAVIVCVGLAMNAAARRAESRLIDSGIEAALVGMVSTQQAIAATADIQGRFGQAAVDPAWLDRALGEPLTAAGGETMAFLIDPAGRVRYGYGDGLRLGPADFATIRAAAAPAIAAARLGRHVLRGADVPARRIGAGAAWAAGVRPTPNGPIALAVTALDAPLAGAAPRRALLIVGVVRIDNRLLPAIGRSIGVSDLRLHLEPIAGSAPLVADGGAIIGGFSWLGTHPGGMMMVAALPILALIVVAMLIAGFAAVRRLSRHYRFLGEREAAALHLAMHDPLSNLPNRRSFTDELTRRFAARAADPSLPAIHVAYIDIDRFKELNDAVGHAAGDAIVTQVGPRFEKLLAPGDLLARIGGDEFAVIASFGEERTPDGLGAALLSAFAEPFVIEGAPKTMTASIGIAPLAEGAADPKRAMRDADISLYRAKDAGRGRYVVFAESMAEEIRERHDIETALRAAIGTPAISMHYQPTFSIRSNAVTSVEALVRWQHPVRGPMNPARFIPIAESAGLMGALGDDIIERVLADAVGLKNVDIAINLSPHQLRDTTLPARLEAMTRARRINPRRIVLEVTETALLHADASLDAIFLSLRERGFRLALDDFGTGYSSLSHLQRFKFDKIKIDRSFVSAGSLEQRRPIVQAVVTIGRGFDMEIIAEGIETAVEFAFVQSLGCHSVQGYWLSKPLPFPQARAFLRQRDAELKRLEPAPLEFSETEQAA